jgi:hypothetical protein
LKITPQTVLFNDEDFHSVEILETVVRQSGVLAHRKKCLFCKVTPVVCGVIFNVRIGKDFGLKNSVFYIRTVLTENNRFLCIFPFTVFIVNEYFTLANVLEATNGTPKNVNNFALLQLTVQNIVYCFPYWYMMTSVACVYNICSVCLHKSDLPIVVLGVYISARTNRFFRLFGST